MSEKRLISSILIYLVLHRRIGWRGLFRFSIDRGRLPQNSRTSFPQPRENDADWLMENTIFLYFMLFSFSLLNQNFNCFSFTSYIVFPFSNRSRFIISFPNRSRRNSIPINTLYKGVDYQCYVLINKSLLERFFSIILPTSLVFLWNLGFVEEL